MDSFISSLIEKSPIEEQPYFRSLLNQKMGESQFIQSQVIILDAVEFFSRPMFAISSKIETYNERSIILQNILEEHGNGDTRNSHGSTYRKYLSALGACEKEIETRKTHSATRVFNKTLMDCAQKRSIMTSVAMMGIIEHRYSTISSIIVRTILEKKWLTKGSLAHYSTHENLDVEHAQGFYGIIRPSWKNVDQKEKIKKGLLLGNSAILTLYNSLL